MVSILIAILSTSSSTNGFGVVRWDGSHFDGFATIDATGLGGLDFNLSAVGFQVIVVAADLNFPFTLNAYTDASNYTSLTLLSGGPGGYFIPFSAFDSIFATDTGLGVDFSNVGALEAIINTGGTTQAVDLEIQLVSVVPEPTSPCAAWTWTAGLRCYSSS
ncbi:MAG: hypothetical protein IPO19_13960 [Rhodoferax sp.]|nr:hypothetical protein [Rhodoferax sp.]